MPLIQYFFFLTLLSFSSSLLALETVTLQLKWKHQFQFAGYYAAFVKGYYKEAGLDVVIQEVVAGQDPVEEVISGRAQYGVGTSELLLSHAAGKQVVVLGVIFQHSPLGLAVRKDSGVDHIHDLVGKSVMIEPSSAELFAYFSREGLKNELFSLQEHSFDIRDLLEGRVDGMSIYVTDEPFVLKQANMDYVLFKPSQGGIDFYGDNFFTTRGEVEKHPERVKAFRDATIKGWQYAMAHPEEIIDLIYQRYTQRHSRLHLAFEAKQMMELMNPSLVEPGYMHEGRWKHIADTYARLGLLPTDYDLSGFMYYPDQGMDLLAMQKWIFGGLLLSIIISSILYYVLRLNKRLIKREVWLKSIVDSAPSALIVVNHEARVLNWNSAAEAIFGWTEKETLGEQIYSFLIPPSEAASMEQLLASDCNTSIPSEKESWSLTKGGRTILCQWRLVAPQSNVMIMMARDITETRKMEAELKVMAHTDALTKVANRTRFFESFEQAILLAKRQNEKVAMLFIDLDDFKIVNDQYGHEVGDVVLCEIVQRIRMAIREADLLARIGGDEFVLMLQNCQGTEKAKQVANKVIQVLERPLQVAGVSVSVGASIGIALYPDHGDTVNKLLKAADKAMYTVKGQAKNGIGLAKAIADLQD